MEERDRDRERDSRWRPHFGNPIRGRSKHGISVTGTKSKNNQKETRAHKQTGKKDTMEIRRIRSQPGHCLDCSSLVKMLSTMACVSVFYFLLTPHSSLANLGADYRPNLFCVPAQN